MKITFSEVCEIPTFTNGHIVPHSRGLYKANETAQITCNAGFEPNTPLTRCTSSRMWDPEPLCCNVTCVVPLISGGYYTMNEEKTTNSMELRCGETITPFCDTSGFTIMPSTSRTCQIDGTLSGTEPVCIPIICNSLPPDIQHGKYDTGGRTLPFSFNHTISPVCNEGYYLQTHIVRHCTFTDTWSGAVPKCLPITCIQPDQMQNGHYNGTNVTYFYGSVLVPTCDKGYFISNNVNTRVCEMFSTWSGNDPLCEIVKCFWPSVQNGLFSPTRNFYEYNTQITIQCDVNFEIKDGQYTRTCQEDGTWGSQTMQCVKIFCNDTRNATHVSIEVYPHLSIGEVGTVLYNSTFFHLKRGSVDVNCTIDRKLLWTNTPVFGKPFYSCDAV